MIGEGADVIDVGGASTRPGSEQPSVDEELRRVIPVIDRLRNAGARLSIDNREDRTGVVCSVTLGSDEAPVAVKPA